VSKRLENHNKSNPEARKKLQALIQASPRKLRILTKKEQQRLTKLEGIVDKLNHNIHVQNRKLQRWLTEEEFEIFMSDWEEQKGIREELNHKSKELKRYEEKLKKVIFEYNKAESYSLKGNSSQAKKIYSRSEDLGEEALEILQEIIHADPSLRIWFDRDLDFEHGNEPGLTPVALPRLVTSRSLDALNTDSRLIKKVEVKINVVERAISALKYDYNSNKNDAKNLLTNFLETDL
jgi:tetratricopeptide (TPR) repeat protein